MMIDERKAERDEIVQWLRDQPTEWISNHVDDMIAAIGRGDHLTHVPIERMEISVRLSNILKKAGLFNSGDISRLSAADLLRLPNLGRKSFKELVILFTYLGLPMHKTWEDWMLRNRMYS